MFPAFPWRTITDKDIPFKGSLAIEKLQLGMFAEMNGSIVYKYNNKINHMAWFPECIWVIEKHGHKPIYEARIENEDKNVPSYWTYFVNPVEIPKKKHIDNAICILKKAAKEKKIDGLSYLENYL